MCESHQHLSIFDFLCVSASLENRVIEYVPRNAIYSYLFVSANVAANISCFSSICISAKRSSGDIHMRFRKREPLLDILLGTGLYLFDNLRERLPDNMDDITSGVTQKRPMRVT